jgi:putative hydrolase of the HAD superfamily
MIKSVIFDLDGTLLDRNKSLVHFIDEQYERLIKDFKHVDKLSFLNRFIELDNRGYVWKDKVYQKLVNEFQLPLDWNVLLTDYKVRFSLHAICFPNTIELLKRLKEKEYKLGLITNGFGDFQTRNIEAIGISDYFDVILISELEGIRKPDPAIFIKAAEKLNSNPAECVYIGDHPTNDVIASRDVGMRGIWKEDTFYSDQFKYDGIVKDLLEVEQIVEQWNLSASQ